MISETELETKVLMEKTIVSLEKKLQRIRTGRANPSILDSVEVDYYGSNTPISQMSNISIEDARTLSIVPWEKDQVQNIENYLSQADAEIESFVRLEVGEGIEVEKKDFAEEVKSQLET